MSKGQKINNSYLADLIWKKGFFKKGKIISVKFIYSKENKNHFIISISSKIFPKAVDRNKIRRQLKVIADKNLNQFSRPVEMMIFLNKDLKKYNFSELDQDYQFLIKQI